MRKISWLTLVAVAILGQKSAISANSLQAFGLKSTLALPELGISPVLNDTTLSKNDIASYTLSDSANGVDNNNNAQVLLLGQAQVRRNDAIMKGDKIAFDKTDNDVQVFGNVRLYHNANLVTGTGLRYNTEKEAGRIVSPEYNLSTNGKGKGSDGVLFDSNHFRLYDATYSGCPCVKPFWHIESPQIDVYNDENEAVAKNATLYVKNVPLFWSPYFSFPIKQEKKTGFLYPTYGYSSRSGFDLTVPYFINLAPNYDLTVTPRYLSKRGLLLNSEFRYLQPSYSGSISGSYISQDRDLNRSRWQYNIKHAQTLGTVAGLNVGLNVDWTAVSDNDYYRDFSTLGLNDADQTFLNQSVGLNFSGYKYWSGSLRVQKYQVLQDTSNPSVVYGQYERLPELQVNGMRYNWGGFDLSSQNTITRFQYPVYFPPNSPSQAVAILRDGHRNPDGTRAISYNTISYPMVYPGWYITPKLGLHTSYYQTNWYRQFGPYAFTSQQGLESGQGAAYGPPSVQTRITPIVSLDSGMTFERDTSLFGNSSIQTLEPRLYYLYVPYRNQSNIPLYDTSINTFGYANAFAENTYGGGWDRINNANQVTLGLTSKWFDKDSGFQRLALQIAQRFYFTNQKVTLPYEAARIGTRSDMILGLDASLTNTFNTQAAIEYDPYRKVTSQAYAGINWKPKRLTNVSLSYRYQQDPYFDSARYVTNSYDQQSTAYQLAGKESVTLAGQWPFTNKLNGVARVDYSLRDKRVTQTIAGFEYKGGCCWTSRVVFQRYAVSSAKANTALFFQLELNGLGGVGTNPLNLLRESVPGYETIDSPVPAKTTFERYE